MGISVRTEATVSSIAGTVMENSSSPDGGANFVPAVSPGAGDASIRSGGFDAATALTLGLIALAWGLNYVVVKNVYAGITPMSYCASRFVVAGVLLLLLARFTEGRVMVERSDLAPVSLLAIFGFGLSNILMAMSLDLAPASITALILSASPIFAIALSMAFGLESVSRRKVIAVLVSILGIYMIVHNGPAAGPASVSFAGIALSVLSAVAWSSYTVFSKPLLKKYSSVRLIANVVFISSIAMIPVSFSELAATKWLSLAGFVYASFVFSIFFSSILPLIYWNKCIARTGPVTVMMSQNLVPVFAMVCAYLMLGEAVAPLQALGGLVVIGSVVLGNR